MPLTGETLDSLTWPHDCEEYRKKDKTLFGAPNGSVWQCELCKQEWVKSYRTVEGIGLTTWYKREFYQELLDSREKI